MNIMLPEYKRMLLSLLKHKVQFMLIGGYAVIFHGYERLTTDMDIWLQPDNVNRERLVLALKEFGINNNNLTQIQAIDFAQTSFFYFGERPSRIDFLTKINGVEFEEAFPIANHLPLEKVLIPVINYDHLILSKIANSRPQDKADIDMLQKINQIKHKK